MLLVLSTLTFPGCSKEEGARFEYLFTSVNGIQCYSVQKCYFGNDYEIVIPTQWKGLPVLSIGEEAFLPSGSIMYVDCSEVKVIQPRAFLACQYLREINLRNVQVIGDFAFDCCYALENVVIPESVTEIGNGAFDDCRSLIEVYFKGDPTILGEDIFALNVALYGMPGGNVEQYAKENGLSFCDIALADQ